MLPGNINKQRLVKFEMKKDSIINLKQEESK